MTGEDIWKAVAPIVLFGLSAGVYGWWQRKERTFLSLIGDIIGAEIAVFLVFGIFIWIGKLTGAVR